jgi:hypothetical protein|tara:strand:- start:1947 stop:2240 length:294 start_codon:yes stop_codon:yes gene_type:complete
MMAKKGYGGSLDEEPRFETAEENIAHYKADLYLLKRWCDFMTDYANKVLRKRKSDDFKQELINGERYYLEMVRESIHFDDVDSETLHKVWRKFGIEK